MKISVREARASGFVIKHDPTWNNYSHSHIRLKVEHGHLVTHINETSSGERLCQAATIIEEQPPQECTVCNLNPICVRRVIRPNGTAIAAKEDMQPICNGSECKLRTVYET